MRQIALAVGVGLLGCLLFWQPAPAENPPSADMDALIKSLAYPGARRYDDSPGGGGIRHARYVTTDKTGDVSAWYRQALDYRGPDGTQTGASEVLFNPIRDAESGYRASVQYITRAPGENPGDIGPARPVYETVLVKRNLTMVAVVVISRGQSEEQTYITLTVIDNVGR